jgi:hypothetical protein
MRITNSTATSLSLYIFPVMQATAVAVQQTCCGREHKWEMSSILWFVPGSYQVTRPYSACVISSQSREDGSLRVADRFIGTELVSSSDLAEKLARVDLQNSGLSTRINPHADNRNRFSSNIGQNCIPKQHKPLLKAVYANTSLMFGAWSLPLLLSNQGQRHYKVTLGRWIFLSECSASSFRLLERHGCGYFVWWKSSRTVKHIISQIW